MAIRQTTRDKTEAGSFRPKSKVRLRTIALPAEHGSWGLVLEPILLGLLVASSGAGFAYAVAAFFAFLAQRPTKIVMQDHRRGIRRTRTQYAQRFSIGYLLVAVSAFVIAVWLGGLQPLIAIALALPFVLVFLFYDLREIRSWQAEYAAPTAFAAIAMAIGLAGGLDWQLALALWLAMVARSVPSVIYVRARLQLIKQKPAKVNAAITIHFIALAAIIGLIALGWLPPLAIVGYAVMLVRTIGGLSRWRRDITAKKLGFIEMGLGLLTVACIAIGFTL